MNRNNWFTLLGVGLALASACKIFDCAAKKKAGKSPTPGTWLTASVGLVTGTAIALHIEKQMRQKLTVEEMLDETDLSRVNETISEMLDPERE